MYWSDYTKEFNIPSEWVDISYGNDELPSFSYKGFTIWVNHPTLEMRMQEFPDDSFKDWRFAVQYTKDYGCGAEDLLRANSVEEVQKFISEQEVLDGKTKNSNR